MSIGNFAELKLLGAIFNSAAYGMANNPYISLHRGDPGETGSNELSGASYARQQAAFDAPASGATQNAGNIQFTSMPAVSAGNPITHVGVWDAVSGGNFCWGGQLSAAKTCNAGDTFQINSSDLDAVLD